MPKRSAVDAEDVSAKKSRTAQSSPPPETAGIYPISNI